MKTSAKLMLMGVITLTLHIFCYSTGIIPFFDYRFFDLISRFKSVQDEERSRTTVVVTVDEESLKRFGQWPWPRIIMAKAVEEILHQRPAVLGLDVLFPEPDRTSPGEISRFYQEMLGVDVDLKGFPEALSDHDRVLAHALNSGPTVLPLYAFPQAKGVKNCDPTVSLLERPDFLQLPKVGHCLSNTTILQQAARGFGYINASFDKDGVFRRLPLFMDYQGKALPNLALAMLMQVDPELSISAKTGDWPPTKVNFVGKEIPFNRKGEVLNRLYPEKFFSSISLAEVLAGNQESDLFSGKLVLIGATAADLYDQFMTPGGEIVPGVYVHAALLENIMQNKVLYQPESAAPMALLLSFLLSLLIVWLVFKRYYLSSWLVYLGAVGFALVVTGFGLEKGLYLSIGYFLTPFSSLFFFVSLFFAVLHYVERKRFLEDLGEAHSATIDSMTMVAESRDIETGAHIARTRNYVRILAEYARNHTEHRNYLTPHIIDLLCRAAPLHDIGKVGIPDAILRKPGALNKAEIEIMRSHVDIGCTIIENAINIYNRSNEFLTLASNIAYTHHEKWDGSGYPLGLKGDEIPLEGRLMSLADVYDALISRRCYREALPFETAEKMIISGCGTHFDPVLIAAFIELKDRFREVALQHNESEQPQIFS